MMFRLSPWAVVATAVCLAGCANGMPGTPSAVPTLGSIETLTRAEAANALSTTKLVVDRGSWVRLDWQAQRAGTIELRNAHGQLLLGGKFPSESIDRVLVPAGEYRLVARMSAGQATLLAVRENETMVRLIVLEAASAPSDWLPLWPIELSTDALPLASEPEQGAGLVRSAGPSQPGRREALMSVHLPAGSSALRIRNATDRLVAVKLKRVDQPQSWPLQFIRPGQVFGPDAGPGDYEVVAMFVYITTPPVIRTYGDERVEIFGGL